MMSCTWVNASMLAPDALSQWHLYWVFHFLGTFIFIKNIQVHYLLRSTFLLLQASDKLVVELAADRQAIVWIRCKPHIRKPQNHQPTKSNLWSQLNFWPMVTCDKLDWKAIFYSTLKHTHTQFFLLIKKWVHQILLLLLPPESPVNEHIHEHALFLFDAKNRSIKSKQHKTHNCF